jgi:hypothetical protein
MEEMVSFEKGSISFCVRKKVVAIVLSRYAMAAKVLMSVRFDQIEYERDAILALLGSYRNGQAKWERFVTKKLPGILRDRGNEAKLMSYEEISEALSRIVWSLEKHRIGDRTGSNGGRKLALNIWQAWQMIRQTISSTTYWGVKEEESKVGAGLRQKNKL